MKKRSAHLALRRVFAMPIVDHIFLPVHMTCWPSPIWPFLTRHATSCIHISTISAWHAFVRRCLHAFALSL